MKGRSIAGSLLNFGDFGLKSLDRGWLSAAQIEAVRRAITNFTKRKAKVWVRVFPDKPISKKAPGSPMGGGKGDVGYWAAVIKPGRIIVEIAGVADEIAKEALKLSIYKLPFRTKIISRGE